MICDVDLGTWERLVSGQSGFILATIIFGAFYWRVLLPRQDKAMSDLADAVKSNTAAIEGLAGIVKVMLVHDLERRGESADTIISRLAK